MDSTVQSDNKTSIDKENSERYEEGKRKPARKKDLATRERVNFVVNSLIMKKLREFSEKNNRKMSRIIDNALSAYLNSFMIENVNNHSKRSDDIILQHLLEIIIHKPAGSEQCIKILKKIDECSLKYIYSNCVFNSGTPNVTLIGTKVFLFVGENEIDKFLKLLNFLSELHQEAIIQVIFDNEETSLIRDE